MVRRLAVAAVVDDLDGVLLVEHVLDPERRFPILLDGLEGAVFAVADRHHAVQAVATRSCRDQVDRHGGGVAAVERSLWPFEDLDAGQFVEGEIHLGERRQKNVAGPELVGDPRTGGLCEAILGAVAKSGV